MTRHDTMLRRAAALFGGAALLLAATGATAADCDGNGIDDALDIANCAGDPQCGDCNLNGVPDGCDISAGTSQDANLDSVPDECATARASGNWTDNIWGLPGGDYPDDVGHAAGLRVTLPTGVIIFLDDTVAIRGLRLEPGAMLRVTQTGVGDLLINQTLGAKLFNQGAILVANDRRIDVPAGEVILGEGGRYVRDLEVTGPVSATLTAGQLTMLPTYCGEPEQLTLSSQMTLATTGDLVMDGRDIVPCPFGAGSVADVLGGKTPPILSVVPQFAESAAATLGSTADGGLVAVTRAAIGGSMRLLSTATLCVGCTAPSGAPLQVIQVGGDFDNRLTRPSFFRWTQGGLSFSGAGPHMFEVGGVDVGPLSTGFNIKTPTPTEPTPHTNFSIGVLHIEGQVRFVNNAPNTSGSGACSEALYVDRLELPAGASILLDNCRIYYNTLANGGADVQALGCGELVAISQVPTVTGWGLIAMALLLGAAAAVVCRNRNAIAR